MEWVQIDRHLAEELARLIGSIDNHLYLFPPDLQYLSKSTIFYKKEAILYMLRFCAESLATRSTFTILSPLPSSVI